MIPGKPKKKESWLGVVITLVLCLGFLYWWFRPGPHGWQHETATQLVARAMKEPRPQNPVEQQVLDFDLMEIAICQVSVGLREEALESLKNITDPVIKLRAVRQTAERYLHTDPQNLANAIAFSDLLTDPSQRGAVRAEVLGNLAENGFPDAALPEAKTALQKATLAHRIAATDNTSKDTARRLVTEAAKELPSLSKPDADAVRVEIAGARVDLAAADGPAEAIAAIEALPESARGELWEDLTGWCISRPDAATCLPQVMQHITDKALRRKLEISSLLMHMKLRAPAELIAECKTEAEKAATPAAKVAALISMAEAQRNAESSGLTPVADETLRTALAAARAIQDPAERCKVLITLARKFCDPPLLSEAKPILEQVAKEVALISSPADRIAVLVLASEESYKQSDEALAVKLMEDAMALVNDAAAAKALDATSMETLALAVVRRGDWPRGLALVERISDEAARKVALDKATAKAAQDSMSVDPGHPPPRGAPVDDIRREAGGDDAKALVLVEKQPAGYARARAWLAMAKGLIGPPANLPANVVEPTGVSSETTLDKNPPEPPEERVKNSDK